MVVSNQTIYKNKVLAAAAINLATNNLAAAAINLATNNLATNSNLTT